MNQRRFYLHMESMMAFWLWGSLKFELNADIWQVHQHEELATMVASLYSPSGHKIEVPIQETRALFAIRSMRWSGFLVVTLIWNTRCEWPLLQRADGRNKRASLFWLTRSTVESIHLPRRETAPPIPINVLQRASARESRLH